MVNYQKLYTLMFNAATDALQALAQQNYGQAREILCCAQLAAEERYLTETPEEVEVAYK